MFFKLFKGKYNKPLIKATLNNNTDEIKKYLKHGADVNALDEYGNTALMNASLKGHEQAVRLLIEAGANVNIRDNNGRSALMQAVDHARTEVVELLLAAKAEVDARSNSGDTALLSVAARSCPTAEHISIVKFLLAAGANINARRPGSFCAQTALMFASMRGCTELVDLLLQAGADVNAAPECGGGTALIYASINGYEEIVKLLLKAGADINAKFIGGMTVFTCAANHPGTLKILKEYNQWLRLSVTFDLYVWCTRILLSREEEGKWPAIDSFQTDY